MFESFKRMFSAEKPKQPQMTLEMQKSIIIDIAQRCASRFDAWSDRVLNGEIASSRLEFDALNSIDPELDEALPSFSKELIEHLRMRAGAHPDASPKAVLKMYIKSKLKPKVEQLEAKLKNPDQADVENETPVSSKIADANRFESPEALDLTPMLKNRPDQHDVLRGSIEGGVYAGTEKTPAILVDGSEKRDAAFDEPSRLSTVLHQVKESVDALVAEASQTQPLSKHGLAIFNERTLLAEAIKTAQTLLPVSNEPLPTEWAGKKITLQHMIDAKRGTPSAQSLLAAYILETVGAQGYLKKGHIRLKRGVSETGAHVFAEYGSEIIDPSVFDEPMDARSNYPDQFYNV